MYCKSCGTQIPDDAAFCAKCGAPVEASSATGPSARLARVLVIVAIVLGCVSLVLVGMLAARKFANASAGTGQVAWLAGDAPCPPPLS